MDSVLSLTYHLMKKLKSLKLKVTRWEKLKKQKLLLELMDIEGLIHNIFNHNISGLYSNEDYKTLIELERRNDRYMEIEEATWRV